MKLARQILIGAILVPTLTLLANAAVWQWSVPVKSEKPENDPARAWLWIPPGCKQVRGVIVAQHNMEEISILENPKFRAALVEMNFAEVWVAPFFDHRFRFNQGAGETFNGMMDNLANESGYSELKFMPGALLGHAGRGAISIDPIGGPVKQISADTFAFDLQKETLLKSKAWDYEVVLAVPHPGAAEYKPAVQQAHLFVPARNHEGRAQHITFPAIPDPKAGTKPMKLNATSDAGTPVYYYVREGPAQIHGDVLKFTAIPPRAKFPIEVTVVAWQYGRSIEPGLKTAEPVERNFVINK